jgi:hypothetical protein
MKSPPIKEKRGCYTALETAEFLRAYWVLTFLQRTKVPARRCVSCNSRITNRNLGGNDGKSALSGLVWCLSCADGRAP